MEITQQQIVDLLKKIIPRATEDDKKVNITIMGVSVKMEKPEGKHIVLKNSSKKSFK
jgi:hypothetical protein